MPLEMTTFHTHIRLLIIIIIIIIIPLLLLSAEVEAERPWDAASLPPSSDVDTIQGSSNVSPPMAVVVIALVLGFFITGCISIYIQHCIDNTSSSAETSAGSAGANAMNNGNNKVIVQGLEQSVIDTFPVFKYSDVTELKIGKGAVECAVCLTEFAEVETLRLLPVCDHVFHSNCIDVWLVSQATCPVCRANLVVDKRVSEPSEPTTSESNSEIQITIAHQQNDTTTRGNYVRSHSTGHSLVLPAGENFERFTLRLPGDVRRQLLARTKLKRTTSLVALPLPQHFTDLPATCTAPRDVL